LKETPSVSEAEAALMVWFLGDLEGWLLQQETVAGSLCTDKLYVGLAKLKWLQLLRDLLFLKPSPALKLVDSQAIRMMLELIVRHPLNNILHNIVRDILVYSIRDGDGVAACDKSCQLLKFLVKTLESNSAYTIQMYHVATALELKRRANRQLSSAMRYCKYRVTQLRRNGHIWLRVHSSRRDGRTRDC